MAILARHAGEHGGRRQQHAGGDTEHESLHSYGSVIVVVPDVDVLYHAFAAGLRAAYGTLPTTGFPRITRPRKKLGAVRGFSVVDVGGNWLRISNQAIRRKQPPRSRRLAWQGCWMWPRGWAMRTAMKPSRSRRGSHASPMRPSSTGHEPCSISRARCSTRQRRSRPILTGRGPCTRVDPPTRDPHRARARPNGGASRGACP